MTKKSILRIPIMRSTLFSYKCWITKWPIFSDDYLHCAFTTYLLINGTIIYYLLKVIDNCSGRTLCLSLISIGYLSMIDYIMEAEDSFLFKFEFE